MRATFIVGSFFVVKFVNFTVDAIDKKIKEILGK